MREGKGEDGWEEGKRKREAKKVEGGMKRREWNDGRNGELGKEGKSMRRMEGKRERRKEG